MRDTPARRPDGATAIRLEKGAGVELRATQISLTGINRAGACFDIGHRSRSSGREVQSQRHTSQKDIPETVLKRIDSVVHR